MAENYTEEQLESLKKLELEAIKKQEELRKLVEAGDISKDEYYKITEEFDKKVALTLEGGFKPIKFTTTKEKEELVVKELTSSDDVPVRDVVDHVEIIQNTVTDANGDHVVLDQETLTNLEIYLPADTTSIEDVQAILEKREIVKAAKIVNFELNYRIEEIPRPDMNKIYSLTTVESNIWDKPIFEQNVDTNELQETHVLKNFTRENGVNFNVSVTGAKDAYFQLAIYNETDKTYYDWNEFSETQEDKSTGIDSITTRTGFRSGVTYFDGTIPKEGRRLIPVEIPASGSEVVYRVGFLQPEKIVGYGKTDYGEYLPLFNAMLEDGYTPLYKLTQLPRSSTTVSLSTSHLSGEYAGSGTIDTEGSLAGGLVINHEPGSILNSSTSTFGKYDIDLKFQSRKKITLSNNMDNGIVTKSHIIAIDSEFETETEVLSMNLIASVEEGNIGRILGTITLGKSSLRHSIINFDTADIFSINPDLI
tara:strand:- start:1322 stop:2755 length:1434 start_codon:yes stop_codon:yes gene_type:complete